MNQGNTRDEFGSRSIPIETGVSWAAIPSKWNELDGEIAVAAYYIWEKEGYPHGRDLDHWLHAEHNVRRLVDAGKTREPAR
ncbi:MAG: DUF2934 domain-containing protein [Isosphaeraceae bacterium]